MKYVILSNNSSVTTLDATSPKNALIQYLCSTPYKDKLYPYKKTIEHKKSVDKFIKHLNAFLPIGLQVKELYKGIPLYLNGESHEDKVIFPPLKPGDDVYLILEIRKEDSLKREIVKRTVMDIVWVGENNFFVRAVPYESYCYKYGVSAFKTIEDAKAAVKE